MKTYIYKTFRYGNFSLFVAIAKSPDDAIKLLIKKDGYLTKIIPDDLTEISHEKEYCKCIEDMDFDFEN